MDKVKIQMKSKPEIRTDGLEAVPHISEFKRFKRVFFGRGVVMFGMVVILAFLLIAIFAPILAPYDPIESQLDQSLQQPSQAHLLGTDALGRDILSRIIFGSRISLIIGISVVFMASIIGMALGLVAGYFGGWTYTIIMRFVDALMSFPMILLALVIASLLGGGIKNVILALGIAMMPGYARLMCGQVLSLKENDYITAARSIGSNSLRVMLRHLAPNSFSSLLVLMTMMLGSTILAEAGLSFLGIGIEPPIAAWGSMIADGREHLVIHPILSIAPGIAMMLVVFAFNMVGDGLRDALDPRLRGAI